MDILFDKNNQQIQELDLLKIFHFTGARRKKYYMYKWVGIRNGRLIGSHLSDIDAFNIKESFMLFPLADESGVIAHAEIIQSPETLRKEFNLPSKKQLKKKEENSHE